MTGRRGKGPRFHPLTPSPSESGAALGGAGAAGAFGGCLPGRLRGFPAAPGLARFRRFLRGGLRSLLALRVRLRLLLADGLDPAARRPASAIGERFLPWRLVLRLEAVIHELQDGCFRAV